MQQKFPQFSKEELYARILCGEVLVSDQILRNPKQLIALNKDYSLSLLESQRYVSRGGEKLEKAIEIFRPLGFLARQTAEKIIVLDAGASSGGFSDCLLQHGCDEIYAVDCGKNQLDFKLRRDPRVHSFEGCTIQEFLQNLPISVLPPPDFVVMDISFRSILALVPLSLLTCQKKAGVFLCKPQFEWKAFCRAQPKYLNQEFSGILADDIAREIFDWFCQQLESYNIKILGFCESPIRGGQKNKKGNLEFLLYLLSTS